MHKITISGLAGSGKSTVGKLLAARLEVPFMSMGNTTRDFALKKYGVNINQFQELCTSKPEIDRELDNEFQRIGKEENEFVMDYRLGSLFIPAGFHVYLQIDEMIAASRIIPSDRGSEFIDDSVETRLALIAKRNNSMTERFKAIYGFNFTDHGHYHLVLDTTKLSPEECVERILVQL